MVVGPRLRLVLCVAIAAWLLLLVIAIGGTVLGARNLVVDAVLWIALASLLFLAPVNALIGLYVEDGVAPGSRSWWAAKRAPTFLVSGSIVFVAGLTLLVPITMQPTVIRVVGAVAAGLGALLLWTAVLALRKRRRGQVGTRI